VTAPKEADSHGSRNGAGDMPRKSVPSRSIGFGLRGRVMAGNSGGFCAQQTLCGALRDFRDIGESAQPAMTAIKEWASQEIFAVNVVLDVIDAVESDAVRGFAAY
jgi:hypothetical protein